MHVSECIICLCVRERGGGQNQTPKQNHTPTHKNIRRETGRRTERWWMLHTHTHTHKHTHTHTKRPHQFLSSVYNLLSQVACLSGLAFAVDVRGNVGEQVEVWVAHARVVLDQAVHSGHQIVHLCVPHGAGDGANVVAEFLSMSCVSAIENCLQGLLGRLNRESFEFPVSCTGLISAKHSEDEKVS